MAEQIDLYQLVKQFHEKYELQPDPSKLKLQQARIIHLQEETNLKKFLVVFKKDLDNMLNFLLNQNL